MATGLAIGYENFTIFLLLLSGWFILQFDVKGYAQAKMWKEHKVAQILGWFNLILGVSILAGHWIYERVK
ncbi:CLC_0170 family protein [Paenibacillus sp. EPM92]|uniref:CLC_0170 family protein n=1 Tax=Paenibacillus sp. EPM92 TaxID=1561195 RepID=UPI001915A670|nr:CLC_0170 family protein [Paenibacillus sp. EPM92]